MVRCANGFGGLALAALMREKAFGGAISSGIKRPFEPKTTHFPAKARSVIFLYMDGGPSQIDTFDPKPLLEKYHGKPFPFRMEPTQFDNIGKTFASPWKFKRHGQSGLPASSLLPNIATCIDDLCFVRSMVSNFPEHTSANYFLHSGNGMQGRPSMGSWVSYGLGSVNENLPGFIVLNGGLIPPGGLDNFNNGYLPATHQGTIVNSGGQPIANINRTEPSDQLQRNKLALLKKLDQGIIGRVGNIDKLESAIANYEMAYRMQTAVPGLLDLSDETAATRELYGFNHSYKQTQIYARQCLLARRLVERGVRFIELTCPKVSGDRWDQHSNLKAGHENNCRAVDQPVAGLLKDLKSRGLLDETLVIWAGEFGRTPFAQGANGRDHNQYGFTIWMAGGGVKGGISYGETDEAGYKVIENKTEIHDLHATMLHLLGMDHKQLTIRFSARDMRLTDVHGEVVHEILA